MGVGPGHPSRVTCRARVTGFPAASSRCCSCAPITSDQESLTGASGEAWALGGWAGLRSPWWGDLFQVGIVGYTSQKLYGPDDKDGSKLLAPGQEPITVLGEAFGAVRILGQTVTAYRQLIDRPFINSQDSRMVPNTFEAYTLTGLVDRVSYTGGYITKKKNRDAESFVWMSNIAGGTDRQEGVIYAGGTWNFSPNGSIRMDEQYAVDVFNTFYVDGKYKFAIDDRTSLDAGRPVLSAELGWGRPDRRVLDLGCGRACGPCARAVHPPNLTIRRRAKATTRKRRSAPTPAISR